MRVRDFLPAVGWTALAFAASGAGAAIAYVTTDIDEKPRTEEVLNTLSLGGPSAGHCVAVAALAGQSLAPEAAKAYEEAEPPLWTDLGSVTFPVTTKSARSAELCRPGHAARRQFQPRRGPPRAAQGAAPRSRPAPCASPPRR